MMIKVDYPLKTSANEEDWVDIEVNKNNKTVNIIWRLAVSDGGIKGSNPKLSPVPYNDLVDLTKNGVEFYWSRNGSRGGGLVKVLLQRLVFLK